MNILRSLSSFGMVGVPPRWRHPQVPSFTQTGMPKYDPFSEPLLLIITFQEMTIKHLMYAQQVPFLYTERACAGFFSVLKFAMEDFLCRKKCCEYFGPVSTCCFISDISVHSMHTLLIIVHFGT